MSTYSDASLILPVAPYIKDGKIYSLKPTDGTGDFDFSRATEATIINKDGLIETVGSNIPRLNYPMIDGVVSGCPSLLLEPQRTNLLPYSEDFSDADWAKFQTSISVNETISPDGTLNADKLISSNVDTNHPISSVLINGSSNNYSASCYFKKGEYDYGFIRLITDSAANRYGVLINLTNGVVENEYTTGSPSNTSYKVDKLKNGWYRLSLTSLNTSGTVQLSISASNVSNPYVAGNIPYFLGDGTSGIYIYGAQLEQGSYATSYIPTNGAIETRLKDEVEDGNTDVALNEGCIILNYQSFIDGMGADGYLTFEGDANNYIQIKIYATEFIYFKLVASGVTIFNQSLDVNQSDMNEIKFKFKSGDSAVKIGDEFYTDSTLFTFGSPLSIVNFTDELGGNNLIGYVKDLKIGDVSLY